MPQDTILVVEDDVAILKQCSTFLRNHGFRVFEALDVEAATDIIGHPDLSAVLVDLQLDAADLNDRSGYTLLKKVRSGVCRLVLTSHDRINDVRAALIQEADHRSLADDFVAKSEGLDFMLSVLQKRLAQRNGQLTRAVRRYRNPAIVAVCLAVAFGVQMGSQEVGPALITIAVSFLIAIAATIAMTRE